MADSSPHVHNENTPSTSPKSEAPQIGPDILIISSAIRDGLSTAMQPVNETLLLLSSNVHRLQSSLYPPSHFGLGSSSIDVLTPPSAFTRQGVDKNTSSAPPSQLTELGDKQVRPSHFGLQTISKECLVPPSHFGLGTASGQPLTSDNMSLGNTDTDFHASSRPKSAYPPGQDECDRISLHADSEAEEMMSTQSGPCPDSIFTSFSKDITPYWGHRETSSCRHGNLLQWSFSCKFAWYGKGKALKRG